MRILTIHNRYRESGGEDVAVQNDTTSLVARGHDVVVHQVSNADQLGMIGQMTLPITMSWSASAARAVRERIDEVRPDIAHIHNTHFRLSLSVVEACRELGVPVVMTLHNYRPMCPAATLFRDGQICNECVGSRFASRGVIHGCWRGSHVKTAFVALANGIHDSIGTFDRVARFIAPSAFTRNKYIEHGFEPERIVVRPHHLAPDPGPSGAPPDGSGFVAVGRLSPEKGTDVLLEAWENLDDIPLRIIGDGPLRPMVEAFISSHPRTQVQLLGSLPHSETLSHLRDSRAMIHPSTCYETFGLAVLEAMATARAVVVADHGAPASLVRHGETGIVVPPGDATSITSAVVELWEDRHEADRMGRSARGDFETGFGEDAAYASLIEIYEVAIDTVT